MAGHSKWANIKRRKESQDAKKTKIYSKLLREITAAVKIGGSEDINANARLRLAIQNAKAANLPKDNITRAIKKASGQQGESYIEVAYEGYGPGGVAILIQGLTNNLNRTVANVRALLNKHGGSLGKQGAIQHLFDHKGYFVIERNSLQVGVDDASLGWIEAGAEEIIEEGDTLTLITSFHDFGTLQKKLEEQQIPVFKAYLDYIPHTLATIDEEDKERANKLLQALEEDDDVQNVYHNLPV